MNNFDVEALKKALVDRTRDAGRDRLGNNLKPKNCWSSSRAKYWLFLILKTMFFSNICSSKKQPVSDRILPRFIICYPSSIVSHGDLDILKEHAG